MERPSRNRACAVAIDDKTIGYLGGKHPKVDGAKIPDFGKTIDTYNYETKEEKTDVATMEYERFHFSCVLIPKCTSNPTVAIRKSTIIFPC